MKNFTKLTLTLALLFGVLGGAKAVNAKETLVYSIDYSTQADKDAAPFWSEVATDASIKIQDGLLVINNSSASGNNWDLQLHIADGVPTSQGLDYKVNVTYKTTTAGNDVTVGLGTWGDGNTVPKYGQSITVKDVFQTQSFVFNNFIRSGDNFVMWQCRSVVGTIYIKKVEVYEVTADGPSPSYVFGEDMESVTPQLYVKNFGVNLTEATPDGEGVYTTIDAAGGGEEWEAQFFIKAPYALPAGQKFEVAFQYKADAAVTAETQTHSAPGDYIYYQCIGNIDFTTSWQPFSQEVTVTNEMNGWQSIAFNLHLNSNTKYYFKEITLKEPKIENENVDFTVTSAGWATFSYNKDISLGTVNGYAAKSHGSYVELIPVTEVPANNPVIIEGAGKYTFDGIASATAIADNDLLVSNGSVVAANDEYYALYKGAQGVGFYLINNGVTIPAGKAYLQIAAAGRSFLGFSDEATAISNVKAETADDAIYNVAGQRVTKTQKGLYIVNGKKVLVK